MPPAVTLQTQRFEVTIAIFEGEAGALSDTICPGTSVQLYAIGGDTYTWGPADVLDDPTSADPIAIITEETTFTVTIESVCGLTELEVIVYVFDVDANASPDTAICVGGEAILSASGGETFVDTFEFVADPTSASTAAFPPITTYFIVELTTIDVS